MAVYNYKVTQPVVFYVERVFDTEDEAREFEKELNSGGAFQKCKMMCFTLSNDKAAVELLEVRR